MNVLYIILSKAGQAGGGSFKGDLPMSKEEICL